MKFFYFLLIFLCSSSWAQLANTEIKENIRDPFLPPESKASGTTLAPQKSPTSFSNRASCDNLSLRDLKVVGILVGKEKRALVQGKNLSGENASCILKEGTVIGEENAEIRAIYPGGMVLVEQITNVYGQKEYLETILPVTSSSDIGQRITK